MVPDEGVDRERWRSHVFRAQSPAVLASWAKRLRYFRFVRAYGGFTLDSDTLTVRVSDPGVIESLGLELGYSDLDGATLDVTMHGGDVLFSIVSKTAFGSVDAAAADAAERFEPRLERWVDRLVDPPVEGWRCVAPSTYPDLYR